VTRRFTPGIVSMATPSNDESVQAALSNYGDTGAVIRSEPRTAPTSDARILWIVIISWIVSGVIHVVLLSLFLIVTVNSSNAGIPTETETISTGVDDEEKPQEANLENDELGGLDPGEALSYNVPRIESVAVPGLVNPTESVGMKDMAEAAPTNIPPPPGFGSVEGTGGPSGTLAGMANPTGLPGGMK